VENKRYSILSRYKILRACAAYSWRHYSETSLYTGI